MGKDPKTNPSGDPAHDARLAEYRRKRDFGTTPEPGGGAPSDGAELLYAVQKHDASRLHYDLRLELDGVLLSWAVPKGPSLDPTDKQLAVRTEDHPIEYGAFEGVIPEGEYGGGTVMLWDRGSWTPIGDPHDGLAKGDFKFELHGSKLRGTWVLARMKPKGTRGKVTDESRDWLLIKKRDTESRAKGSFNVLSQLPRSVASGRSMREIADAPERVWTDDGAHETGARARAPGVPAGLDPSPLEGAKPGEQPESLKPQLATLADEPPPGDDWIHEVKLDGYRLLAFIHDGLVTLRTRNGHDWTDRFPRIARALTNLPLRNVVLDGEVIAQGDDGFPDFQRLQATIRGKGNSALAYLVFDVPFAGGYDLRRVPLIERKGYLERLLGASAGAAPVVSLCEHITGHGPQFFREVSARGAEGVVAKRASSRYESRRTHSWLKIKARVRDSYVVGGYSPPSGSRSGFGSLLVGERVDGRLEYRGRVGSGFTERDLETLLQRLGPARKTNPFDSEVPPADRKGVSWVEPALDVQVEFTELTQEGSLRHPVFLGVREDLVAPPGPRRTAAVEGGSGSVAGIRITNPGRLVYPDEAITKLDVARYYERIAPRALEHLGGRPLTVVRCPEGLVGESFYQRHVGQGFPDAIRGIDVDDEDGPLIVIEDAKGLVALAQFGVLELHPWQARIDRLDRPDRMILDLDPGPGVTWPDVVASAHVIREFVESLGLEIFVKTSGGRGVHLVAPIARRHEWSEVKAFSKGIADALAKMAPLNFVSVQTKTLRQNRIYIDYLRNQHGTTAVGAYSTRARDGACVSTPLAWDELTPDVGPDRFTILTVPDRPDDPWHGFSDVRQSLTSTVWSKLKTRSGH